MPLISVYTNRSVDREKADRIKEGCGSAISLIPGKDETWLMVDVEGDRFLYFGGSDAPCVMTEVKIFRKAPAGSYDALTAALCDLLSKALDVPTDRIYVKYEEVSHWGYNSFNF